MANYTSDEIQTAVEQIIRSSVRTPTGAVGERRVDTTFTDLQEAASGVYVLYYNAPFYTIGLGTTRLADAVQTQQNTLSSITDAIRALGNIVTPVEDISALANARAALQELEGAVSARAQGFSDISKVPAFRRYAQNLSQWVSEYGSNVKGDVEDAETGATVPGIVDTPSGAKSKIPGLVKQMVEQHKELVRRATLLAGAMDDFAKLQLPQVTAQGVISRARQVLDDHYDMLSGQTPDERLTDLRSVVLDLLTQQPLVQQYGAALGPSEYITTKGRGFATSDGNHLSTPAKLVATEYGPYPITAENQFVQFNMDGGASFEFPMPIGYVAELRGIFPGPYLIDSTNDALVVEFGVPGSMTRYNVGLTQGTFDAEAIAVEVNSQLGVIALRCEVFFSPTKYDSHVTTTVESPNVGRFSIMGGMFTGLVEPGDETDILDGPDVGTTWTITFVDPAGLYFLAAGVADITPVGLPDGVHIKVGPAMRAVRLIDTDAETSLTIRRAISLPVTNTVADVCAATLGFYPGMQMQSRPVAAKDVATYIAKSTTLLSASSEFTAIHYTGGARAFETDYGRVVLSEYYGTGSISTGMVATYAPDTALPVAVQVGHKFVVRASITPEDINKVGTVVQLEPTILISFATPLLTVGAITAEIGPNVLFSAGDVLQVTSGPNRGRYVVREDAGYLVDSPLEVLLESALPVPIAAGTFAFFSVEFGADKVVFESRVAQTNSEVVVDNAVVGQGAEYFFAPTGLPASAQGTTPWIRFDQFPMGAQVGDIMQLFETDFTAPSRVFSIVGVEQGTRTLQVKPGLLPDDNFSFAFDTPVPFGRIRVAKVADFQAFRDQVNAWLALPEQQQAYLTGILPILNPLLTTSNPTTLQIGDAIKYFVAMSKVLTIKSATNYAALTTATLEYALQQYTPPAEESVDTLLSTFRHKGADRAIDLLLEGQFGTFFGLSLDTSSYSGALLQGIRDMAREDLPVRKFERRKLIGQTVIGTSPDQKDSEFNADDADSPKQPDIPIGDSVVRPGANY